MAAPAESLLVFSDVHLGSDLNDSGPFVPRSAAVDRDLARLIAHYREEAARGERWRIVIAGDLIDFVGMAVDPKEGEELETSLTAEERRNGVGSAEDHARLKLARVAERHADVFDELARFVASGHAVTVLHGNHDIELHWEGLRGDFRRLLTRETPEGARADAEARVEFAPWFFYREGFVYIEHGHQYDPFCATRFVLSPVSPRDPRRVERGFSETLLRSIVRRTPGLKEHGHEERGLASYIGWGLTLGVRGSYGLLRRFFETVAELVRIQRGYASPRAEELARRHEEHLDALARDEGHCPKRLRRLRSLQSAPIATTLRGVLASVMLDRLGVGAIVVVLLVLTLVASKLGVLGGAGPYVAGGLVAAWIALHVFLSRGRGNVDPAEEMVRRAADIAEIFPAPFVVMGHTHVPRRLKVGASEYINVGGWSEEEPEPGEAKPYRAPRTHLVLHPEPSGPTAHFRAWHPDEGPKPHE
jgi:UDP-2,3-diacylglucosamine pyrophosphatase LpxH